VRRNAWVCRKRENERPIEENIKKMRGMKVSTRAEQGILKKLQYVVVIDSPYLQPQTPYAT